MREVQNDVCLASDRGGPGSKFREGKGDYSNIWQAVKSHYEFTTVREMKYTPPALL